MQTAREVGQQTNGGLFYIYCVECLHLKSQDLNDGTSSDTNHINDNGTEISEKNKEDFSDPTGELLEKTTYLLR